MSDHQQVQRLRPPPVPATREEMRAGRKVQVQDINNEVDVLHDQKWDDEDYRQLFNAVYNEDAVEGSLIADDFAAATMIRDYARELDKDHFLARKGTAAIAKALRVVMKRCGLSRKERAAMVQGEHVDMTNDDE